MVRYSVSDDLFGVTALIPAPATLPATPTEVVAALPAILSGTVTSAHAFSARVVTARRDSWMRCFMVVIFV